MRRKSELPELLAPAGDLEKLKIAVLYGADAVYIAGQNYGARAYAKNFTIEEIENATKIKGCIWKQGYKQQYC